MRIFQFLSCCVAYCLFNDMLLAEPTEDGHKDYPVSAATTLQPQEDASPDPSTSKKPTQDEESRASLAAPNATIAPDQIVEFGTELPRVKKLIESALALTTLRLTYTYGSDNPANGGMDCSGFTSYILQLNGFNAAPRDASEQYIWLRKAGTFRAVLSKSSKTFELDDLRPGDLLFWMGTNITDHDPAITHTMIYLGTEKATMKRIMVGSSDGRSYHSKSRWGVSVFDFQLESKSIRSRFVGYACLPGLRD